MAPLFMIGEVAFDMIITKQMQRLIDEGIQAKDLDAVKMIGLVMLAFVFCGVICGFLSGVFANIASSKYANDLRKDLYAKIMQLSYNQTDSFSTASLITRVTNDVTVMQNFVAQLTRFFIRQFGMFFLGIFFTIRIDIRFGLILLIALPIEIVIMLIFMKKAFPKFTIAQERTDALNTVAHENLTGARVVKAFSKEDYEQKRFAKATDQYIDVWLSINKMFALIMPLFMIIVFGIQVAIYAIGGRSIFDAYSSGIAPDLTVGKITQGTTYVMMICFSLMTLGMVFVNFARASASGKRINAVLDCPLEIVDGNLDINSLKCQGKVEFRNVCFAYPGSDVNVLDDISFTINKGETIAIVGATGSGKTTLVNLITRFYDVTSGAVLVDDHDVKEFNQIDLRNKISIALQKSELFAGTIKENILWGNESASDEQIHLAAKIAQADEYIMQKPKQFDEYIEEKGTSLSGGQKQRLSIARAIVKKPEILIFDDATSALDLVTEANLYKAMRQYINDTTRIVVAQRVATAKNADKIIVLDGGKIVAFDSHDNLLKNCQVYIDIYNSQLKREGVFDE